MKRILLVAITAFLATACVTVRSEKVGYTEEQLLLTYERGCRDAATDLAVFCPKYVSRNEVEEQHCREMVIGACLEAGAKFIQELKK